MELINNNLEVHSSEFSGEVSSSSIDPYPLPPTWRTFICTEENMRYVYGRFMEFPILFDDNLRGDFLDFCKRLISSSSINFLTGDYGLVTLQDIVPFRDTNIHLCFWDRRFKGRDIECKQAMKWLFDKMVLARATIVIPETARATASFILSMGFKKEGLIRSNYMYKGKLLNSLLFGILREEVFKEEL